MSKITPCVCGRHTTGGCRCDPPPATGFTPREHSSYFPQFTPPHDTLVGVKLTEVDKANPKDAAGRAKLPLHLVPETATAAESLAFLEGYLKYGNVNWRNTKVYASVYVAAQKRHMAKWAEGEESDPKTGVPHLGYARACIAIIIDAQVHGTLIDDRNMSKPTENYSKFADGLVPIVGKLFDLFGAVKPKHFTKGGEWWTSTSPQASLGAAPSPSTTCP